jgi:hypothetical protein
MILVILKFSYLAALAVMSVCPVCKNQHQKEVSHCSRCNWSMQDDIGIPQFHLILETCIPTLVNILEEEIADKKNLQLIIQKLELQEADSHKLDEILDEIETDREQTNKQFSNLEKIINELKPLLEAQKNFSDISSSAIEQGLPELNQISKNNTAIKDNNGELMRQSNYQLNIPINSPSSKKGSNHDNNVVEKNDRNTNNNLDLMSKEQENSHYDGLSDRNVNNDPNPTDEPPEGSLYNETGDREPYENLNSQADTEYKVNSNRNYQSLYRLINNGELEVTKVTIPQETMEKIRGGTQSEFKFVNELKGNYWIVNWHDVYCLIPKKKINIEEHSYGIFQRIFDCQNYKENSSDFEIVEPATVFNSNNGTWHLERKGTIKFI